MAERDEMSFSRAFADARREMGAGKTFTWRGSSYTTDMAEEAPTSRRAPAESSRPQARQRPVDDIARTATAAIDRAEGKPTTRPQQNPRRVPGPNEGTATSVSTPSVERSSLPASVQRAVEEASTASDRRAVERIARQGTEKRVPGGAIAQAIRNWLRGEGPTDPSTILREGRDTGMAKGGMAKKKGYAKGGSVKTGSTDRRKNGMFYDSKSPRGYK
jgi:hypothetical protein